MAAPHPHYFVLASYLIKPNKIRGKKAQLARGTLINSDSAVPQLAMGANPLRPTATVQMRYCDRIALTSSNTAAHQSGSQYEFRLNSIYDPNLTSTGHQPYMHDQLAALYGRYRVDKVDVQIDVIPSPSTSHCVTAMIQGPSGGLNIGGTGLDLLIENTRTKNAYALATAVEPPTMRFSVDIAEYLGIGHEAYQADLSLWGAAMGANPTRTCYLNLCTSTFAGTSETIQAVVTLVYHVKLWDPVTFGQS